MKRLQWVQFMAKNMANKIGIDTNVLVRYIMQDDEQSKIATEFLENLSIENQGVINTVVVMEVIWVLSRSYKQPKETIALVLEELFLIPVFVFDNLPLLLKTLAVYKESKADFSDIFIRLFNQSLDCEKTVTFDVGASKKAGMVLLTN